MYKNFLKRVIDISLSFTGLVLLSPVFIVLIIAIKVTDPGPAFFTQKRVGKGKSFFPLHKFRSMKMSTPRDTPTHLLENPEQYITSVGSFLRKSSLDELPQIWDILIGNMSIIGPRPALWNQDDLVAERDKYGANDVYHRTCTTGNGKTNRVWYRVVYVNKLNFELAERYNATCVNFVKTGIGKQFMLFQLARNKTDCKSRCINWYV